MTHQQALTREQLEAVTREALGPAAVLRSARELTEGTFNTAYALHLADGRQVVLKVAPPPEAPVLTYERHLLHTEALCLRAFAERTTVPVPRLLHVGSGSAGLARDHVLTSLVPGASWASQAHAVSPAERRRLRHQLGGHVAAMHRVTGEGPFGYPAPGSPLTGPTWVEAYQRIIAALVDDAARYGAQLPLPAQEVGHRLAEAAETALVPVQVPCWCTSTCGRATSSSTGARADRSSPGSSTTSAPSGPTPRSTSPPWRCSGTSARTRTSSPATAAPAARSSWTPPPATGCTCTGRTWR